MLRKYRIKVGLNVLYIKPSIRESLVGIIGGRGSNRIGSLLGDILNYWVLEYIAIGIKYSSSIKTIKELLFRFITA